MFRPLYVDSTPRAADVQIDGRVEDDPCRRARQGWHSYYAIDVTVPGSPSTEDRGRCGRRR